MTLREQLEDEEEKDAKKKTVKAEKLSQAASGMLGLIKKKTLEDLNLFKSPQAPKL